MNSTQAIGTSSPLLPRVKLGLDKRQNATSGRMDAFLVKQLSGEEIRRLMRVHRRTIRSTASGMGITMKRVREVRARGVQGDLYVWEWSTYLAGGEEEAR